jgi:hypothetical protein
MSDYPMSDYTLTSEPDLTSSRQIPTTELNALISAYGGQRCILTQTEGGMEDGMDWAHLIPRHEDETTLQARRA